MKTGTVLFYKEKLKYGFIRVDNSEQKLFVHKSGLIDSIEENNIVSFEEIEGDRGPIAVNVKVIITTIPTVNSNKGNLQWPGLFGQLKAFLK